MQGPWETQFRSLSQEDPLEEEMATHSSVTAWEIPWTEEPDGLQFMESQRVGHNWSNLACTRTQEQKHPAKRRVKWSESRSVVSYSLPVHGLYSPRNSPGHNTGVGSLSLLQGIFPTQGLNPGLPHGRRILYQLSQFCGLQGKTHCP